LLAFSHLLQAPGEMSRLTHFGSTKPAHFLRQGFVEHFVIFPHKIGRPKVLRGFNRL
jgi:hypothetical protein